MARGTDITPVAEDARRPRPVGALVLLALALVAAGALLGVRSLHARSASAPKSRTTAEAAPADGVDVRVTRDFGATTMRSRVVTAGGSVMDALRRVGSVETAYGGGFVDSIDGVSSGYTAGGGRQEDWFFYVDGLLSDRGAADYALAVGERVWWDFHRWDVFTSVPAVVGQYPEPFVHGYQDARPKTQVVYAEGFREDAESVAAAIRAAGAKDVVTKPFAASTAYPADGVIVAVGAFRELSALDWVADAASHPRSSGVFATFTESATRALSVDGVSRSLPAAGAVLATARADAPGTAAWLVTGSEASDVHAAAALLAHRPGELAGRFGVLVPRSGDARALPLEVVR